MNRTGARGASGRRTALGRGAAVMLAVAAASLMAIAPSAASASATPKTATTISAIKNAKLGTILVAGNTVYALKPSKTACDAKCLKAWPPVLLPQGVTSPTAGSGVDASQLGVKPTSDGAMQITYAGKALYWFVKDTKPGQVKGNVTDKWGKWYTVVTVKSSSGSGGTTNAGTGGTAF